MEVVEVPKTIVEVFIPTSLFDCEMPLLRCLLSSGCSKGLMCWEWYSADVSWHEFTAAGDA